MTDTNKIDQVIKTYKLSTDGENVAAVTMADKLRSNPDDLGFIKENKPAVIARIIEIKAEKQAEAAATKAATVEFKTSGWESHSVSVDTRKDINEQLQKIADYYPNDCTLESLQKDFAKALNKQKVEAEEDTSVQEATVAIFAKAEATGEKQLITSYIGECNNHDEDCSWDHISVWAMPNGVKETTRQHTY